ncbi:MAG: hypothetical protein DMG21_15495 [Acidobacteria bacterium]|nr:MAG: hypothetical protein DMG21_15495 [Acidobacteriota bacterium]
MAGQSWAKVRSALLFHATSHGEAFEGQVAPSEALTLTQLDTASAAMAEGKNGAKRPRMHLSKGTPVRPPERDAAPAPDM